MRGKVQQKAYFFGYSISSLINFKILRFRIFFSVWVFGVTLFKLAFSR